MENTGRSNVGCSATLEHEDPGMKKLFPEDSAPLVAGSSSPRLGQNMLGHKCSAIPIFDPVAEGYHDDNYINIQKG